MAKSYGNIPQVGRVVRSPQHRFNLQTFPFQIQPFMLAPVIPGETLKNLLIQSRVVTDPIKSPLIGWWKEYYFFYVKHRDLAGRDDFTEMMLNLEKDMSSYNEAADVRYNHYAGTINWAKLCLDRVVETYFRDQGDTGSYLIDTMPVAAVNTESWINSAILDDGLSPADVDLTVGVDDVITASEIDQTMKTWAFMHANAMTEMSYEDWLATYGIKKPRTELHRPELLRYMREWQYPSNTVNPADGSVASAVSWAIRDRADKDRFFTEPGFIFGVTITRPKVYLTGLDGSAADAMNNALAWLPALMRDDPQTSMMEFGPTAGPLAAVVTDSEGYWIDIKDLLLYGDDFVNYTKAVGTQNAVALPSAGLTNKDFPSTTDMQGLFVGATDATRRVREDGIVTLSILGTQTDTSPSASMGT